MKTPKYIICHHTGGTLHDPLADTSHHTFEDVNAWHRQDPNVWLGQLSSLGFAIGYTYFIDKTGKVTQGRADNEQSAHTKGYNNNEWDLPGNASIGICLAGNFDRTMPTEAQINALRLLLRSKMVEYRIPIENIVPHRHFASKSCYGNLLSNEWARNLILPPVKKVEPCQTEKDVIIEKDKQISNLQSFINVLIGLFNRNKLGSNNNNFMSKMSSVIVGLLVAGAGSLIAVFGFSDSCSSEILAKLTPFIGTLPGLVIAWVARVRGKDVQPVTPLGRKI